MAKVVTAVVQNVSRANRVLRDFNNHPVAVKPGETKSIQMDPDAAMRLQGIGAVAGARMKVLSIGELKEGRLRSQPRAADPAPPQEDRDDDDLEDQTDVEDTEDEIEDDPLADVKALLEKQAEDDNFELVDFKSAAAQILGEDYPKGKKATKANIVKALEKLVADAEADTE